MKMTHNYILDDNGEPVPCEDVLAFGTWFGNFANRIVKQEHFRGLWLSTVFLGIDHNFGFDGRPVLWETMVFGKSSDLDCWCRRYQSRQDAIATHERIAELLRQGVETQTDLDALIGEEATG